MAVGCGDLYDLDAFVGFCVIASACTGILAMLVAIETFHTSVCLTVLIGDQSASLEERHAGFFFGLPRSVTTEGTWHGGRLVVQQ